MPAHINNDAPKQGNADRKPEYPAYKYSRRGKSQLHEAIILVGIPVFLKYDNKAEEFKAVERIEERSRVIRPPTAEEYPYEPYEFLEQAEVESYQQKAKNASIDSLYNTAASIVKNYNDQDSYKLTLLGADVVWSYFQDKFSTTHYVGVIGDNGSGKSTVGDTFESIGYRAVNITDPTAPNLFRLLGILEAGQCTIIADEAEKIDQSPDIMSVLKTGYHIKGKVARINMNTGKQEFFFTYCLKLIIAERSPDQRKAKGVKDRIFEFNTFGGKPPFDLKEVFQPAGDKKRQELLDEVIDFRKTMLIYRLIHSQDPIPEIDIGIQGRDKELCKPTLQLFQNTKSYDEIVLALQKFLDEKKRAKGNSLEAALHPIIANLVAINGRPIYASQVWSSILENIDGFCDERRPNEYQTHEFGTIYRNTITNLICDKFGADRRHKKAGTLLTFDEEKLVRVGHLYNIDTKIQMRIRDSGNGESGESGDHSRDHISLSDHHETVFNSPEKSSLISADTDTNTNIPTNVVSTTKLTNELVNCFWNNQNKGTYGIESSPPSPPSPKENLILPAKAGIAKSIYRIYPHSDIFACANCRMKGDKWEM
jgi:hypothetical protein